MTDVGSHCSHPACQQNRATCLILKPSDRERQKINPPRMHSTDPAQPMNRAAPSSNLQDWRGGKKCMTGRPVIWTFFSSVTCVTVKQIFILILNTYFWATKRGSKKSVVILWAYMEHAVIQQRPAERNRRLQIHTKMKAETPNNVIDCIDLLWQLPNMHLKCYLANNFRPTEL